MKLRGTRFVEHGDLELIDDLRTRLYLFDRHLHSRLSYHPERYKWTNAVETFHLFLSSKLYSLDVFGFIYR